ncbi:uracil-DNA glycosylase family protein [Sphingomonas tabacisoli]|uniref:Uracil-DNA glycosylase family protein n=1 Tax=Sphingomonas tabacisoli TaxID=2249466 RepID=A0ABW4I2N3_9SPHN
MEGVTAFSGHEAAASLIRWWRDAGVDTLVDDEPRDWLATSNPLPTGERVGESDAGRGAESARRVSAPLPGRSAAVPLPGGERVELPADLTAFVAWMRESADVPEARWGRTRLLPAGNAQADLMILIDAPDRGDAETGTLLSGSLGALFDKMLGAIGRDRSSIWLASFATVRPVGRVPEDALKRLTAIARHHIGLVAPKRLLIMGDLPSRALLGTEVMQARGELRSLDHGNATVEAVATFHPRLLDERPAFKAQAWKDLQLLMKGL